MRRAHRLPLVLSPEEVSQFFEHVPSLKYRAALMTCYGAGLRISEAVALKAGDIDSKRMLIRVEEGKGGKDRYTMLSPRLLAVLRCYARAFFRALKPEQYLFPSWRSGRHMNSGALSLACREASQGGQMRDSHRNSGIRLLPAIDFRENSPNDANDAGKDENSRRPTRPLGRLFERVLKSWRTELRAMDSAPSAAAPPFTKVKTSSST